MDPYAVMVLDRYRAVADYDKENATEVSLKSGDCLEVIEKNDHGMFLTVLPRRV